MKTPYLVALLGLLGAVTLWGQKPRPQGDRPLDAQTPLYMPYQRIVSSAGEVVTYGNPRLENHTLDLALLPGGKAIVVEDRYGIAVLDRATTSIIQRWSFPEDRRFAALKSTYSGIQAFVFGQKTYIVWSAAGQENAQGGLMIAQWVDNQIQAVDHLPIAPRPPAPGALPNAVAVSKEGAECFLYVVLNGNNQLSKINFATRRVVWTVDTGVAPFDVKLASGKVYVSNWAGPLPTGLPGETAGVPYGQALVDPRTGATARGTVQVFNPATGVLQREISVGLHPNAMVVSPNGQWLFVANGNSDDVSQIDVAQDQEIRRFPVGVFKGRGALVGSTPNSLAIDSLGQRLYVANGMDHALAVVDLVSSIPQVLGYIPTEAFPAGLQCIGHTLYVANLEAKGARVLNQTPDLQKRFPTATTPFEGAYNAHEQLASLSIIPVPTGSRLRRYTKQVEAQNFVFLQTASQRPPRPKVPPRPVPERIGEPSVFKHVLYIIKENRTYDQVFGDFAGARGAAELCVFGDSITPNHHLLAKTYTLLDNYYVSGKSSAEGHQWASAGIVSDYVEKNVRGWFRSYPHRQYDALVYTREGYIWNHALDHGKSVRIYGEACDMEFDPALDWSKIYQKYLNKEPFEFKNTTTISRVLPILSQNYPGYDDPKMNDQMRADAFIAELAEFEKMPGDALPELMIMTLPNDHTAGMSPGYPTVRAMVADNDLALGKILAALTKSRFWKNTVVFVAEDDSQNGWDHISAYRSATMVVSPYSRRGKVIHTHYNQVSLLRTIEQILGLPPMNTLDATADPMFDCFSDTLNLGTYEFLPNRIPLNEMNKSISLLEGSARNYAELSLEHMEEGVDKGEDDTMNRIIWYAMRGEEPYPTKAERPKASKLAKPRSRR